VVDDPQIRFRPLAMDDLELMHHWLKKDFVARWWPGWPTREQVRAKYLPRIEGREPTKCYLIGLDSKPVGFIQCYYIRDWLSVYSIGPEGDTAAGIDLFLGDRKYAYQGLGPRAIRQFLREVVFAEYDVDSCIIGPAQNNHAAIRAYEKVGFRYLKTVSIPGELEPEYLMRIMRSELEHA
jgi:aminoglycoside 6'-N-acetyltransferase